jgi:carboxymethylenebutenolidase
MSSSSIEVTAEDGHRFGAYRAGAADAPRAIVMIDALPGDTAYVHRAADRLAAFGYRVLAPDLVARVERGAKLSYAPFELARSKAIRDRLGGAEVMLDLAATYAAFGHAQVGVLGFGWGGTAAWHAATRLKLFRAAVCFYGGGIAEARQQTPNCPVQLIFAEGDHVIPLSDVESIRRAQPQVSVTVYPGSHAFACEEREFFNIDSWLSARETMLGFFRRNL